MWERKSERGDGKRRREEKGGWQSCMYVEGKKKEQGKMEKIK